ncbi:hypothetical protein [Agrobacterium burrii]
MVALLRRFVKSVATWKLDLPIAFSPMLSLWRQSNDYNQQSVGLDFNARKCNITLVYMENEMIDPFSLSDGERNELAPDGNLKMAVAIGPASSAVWCTRNANGFPEGITVGIAKALTSRWSLSLQIVEYSSSGDIVADASSGNWTLSCTPVDDERRAAMEVGPNYYLGVSTYLARKTIFSNISEVDRAGVRVVGVAGTATIRSAAKSLRNATIQALPSLDEAVAMFERGEVDAVALGKESILSLAGRIEGTEAVRGHFHEAGTAIVAPKKHCDSIAAATRAIHAFKYDGTMRRLFDQHALRHAEVAP